MNLAGYLFSGTLLSLLIYLCYLAGYLFQGILLSLLIYLCCSLIKYIQKLYKHIGSRFASDIDVYAFSRAYNVTLQIVTIDERLLFGSSGGEKISLHYNKYKLYFSPTMNTCGPNIDTSVYSDFFYESLVIKIGDDKDVIIRRVKCCFRKNFWRMKCFYHNLFECRAVNYFFGDQFFQCIPQNVVKDPDTILQRIPEHLRESAKLTLVDIDCLSNQKICQLYNHDSDKKWIIELKKLSKICSKKKHSRLTRRDILHMGDKFMTQLLDAPNQKRFIEEEIEKCQNNRKKPHQLGSERVGDCKLHALGSKLSPLFAADIIDFAISNRTDKRIILRYKPPGFLYYYSILFDHQYKVIKFARKFKNIDNEIDFLACFNIAKYKVDQNTKKWDYLLLLLRPKWSLFGKATQNHLYSFQNKLESLLLECNLRI